MVNRRERRAAERRRRRGQEEPQYKEQDRSVSGALDAQSLNTRSVHLQDRKGGEWKPSSSTQQAEAEAIPSADPGVAPDKSARNKKHQQKSRERSARRQERLQAARAQELHRRRAASRHAHPIHWWFTVLNWALLICTAIAFIVMIWVPPKLPVIIVVTVLFCLGVLNIFFLARPMRDNPNLDENGTAI